MRTLICTLFAALTLQAYGQVGTDPFLLTIDQKSITKSEFEAIYRKNNRDSLISNKDLDEYMELFINFKLKVMEAESMGRDTASQFVRELAGYREQLARPYLVDKAITDSLVREAYDRMLQEVRASHILVKIAPEPSPADTLAAWNKIMAIKAKLSANADNFNEMAKLQSEDPSAKTNAGDLGYFTSLQMVYPFENAVFRTPVGKIGGPVRTQFGYHIVTVTDRRPARGQVRVAHIMVRTEDNDPEEVRNSNKKRIDEVYTKLQSGEKFGDLARKFSDDRTSAEKDGELPVFGAGKMVAEFEEAAFSLKNPVDFTAPVLSPYGWHIILLLEKIPVGTYDELEKDLRSRIGRDTRSEITRDTFIAKRKAEYNFNEDLKSLKAIYKEVDTSYFSGNWVPSAKLLQMNKTIFTLDGINYTQSQFGAYLQNNQRAGRKGTDITATVNGAYKDWVNTVVMDYENQQLEPKHPEFKALMSEYRDGILLFDLTDERVWTRAVKDSAGLADYYEKNKTNFMWGERASYDLYIVEDEATGKKVQKMLKKGKSLDEIRNSLNIDSALKVRVESALKEKADVPLSAKIEWKVGVSPAASDGGQLKIVNIKEIRQAQPKEFNEARGLITAAYQNYLESEWIKQLRASHKVNVNKEVLYSIK